MFEKLFQKKIKLKRFREKIQILPIGLILNIEFYKNR